MMLYWIWEKEHFIKIDLWHPWRECLDEKWAVLFFECIILNFITLQHPSSSIGSPQWRSTVGLQPSELIDCQPSKHGLDFHPLGPQSVETLGSDIRHSWKPIETFVITIRNWATPAGLWSDSKSGFRETKCPEPDLWESQKCLLSMLRECIWVFDIKFYMFGNTVRQFNNWFLFEAVMETEIA